jgi:4-amino-4-deoxy-L-arabinose transferase-like glycosyltransferase
MRARWNALSRQTQVVIGLAVAFVLFRTIIASLSGFGFHQGWNEGHYALLGSGFLDHPLVPRYGDRFVYSVPPLFPYTISVSFLLFGESVLAARLPSILATGGLIFCTYELGREVFEDRSPALIGAVILATLPYVQLYGGRAQTDIMMVFLLLLH